MNTEFPINEETQPALKVVGVISSTSESQIESQIEQDDLEDSQWFDDEEEDEILGYVCLGCGNIQDHQSGFGCDRCMGQCLEPWYG